MNYKGYIQGLLFGIAFFSSLHSCEEVLNLTALEDSITTWSAMGIRFNEQILLMLIGNGKREEAKKCIKELFYRTSRKHPSAALIREASLFKTDQKIIPLLVEALPDDICYKEVVAVGFALQVAAQEGNEKVIEYLNTFFISLYENLNFALFEDKEEAVYTKIICYGEALPFMYRAACHAYLYAFDRAAYAGHTDILKSLLYTPYLQNRAHHWKTARRPHATLFSSALHAAALGKKKETILFLLNKGAEYTGSCFCVEQIEETERAFLQEVIKSYADL